MSSLPARAIVQNVTLRIKAKFTGTLSSAKITEIYSWDGSSIQGRNQAGVYDPDHSPNSPIDLTTTNEYHERGAAGWLWWWIERLKDSDNGVAIRAEAVTGNPTVEIDHVQFEITYVELFQRWPTVDYRPIAYDVVAGSTYDTTERNENDDMYHPGDKDGVRWHYEPIDFLETIIEGRTLAGIQRVVFATPAGHLGFGDVSSAQWEPMYDNQRVALTSVIPAWLAADPRREAIVYLGTNIKDPAFLDMGGAEEPDVSNPEDVARLKRTLFPYRDLVGIRRFLLDASSAIDRSLARDLFAWGRENGMEFVMEAIPFLDENEDLLDETITEVYSAYARSGFIIGDDEGRNGNDPNLEWSFSKGRLLVRASSGDYDEEKFDTPAEQRAFLQQFAREGYVLMPRNGNGFLDEPAHVVSAEYIGRGVTFPAVGSATFRAVCPHS